MNWQWVIRYVRYNLAPHREVCYPDTMLPPPEKAGFIASIGEGPGRHYRLSLSDGTGIHIRHYNGYFCIHWDICDPSQNLACHLLEDSPHLVPPLTGATLTLYKIITKPQVTLQELIDTFFKGFLAGIGMLAIKAILTSIVRS